MSAARKACARSRGPQSGYGSRFQGALSTRTAPACHGADGRHGAAVSIGDPVYLALASDDAMRSVVSKGRPGTAMSAFAQKEGGMLTDAQVDAIIHGIRQRWSNASAVAGVTLPPYAANATGDAQRGQAVYDKFCASCHGNEKAGGPKAGSVLDPAYLSLITNQGLRTIVITGRPDFNAPDWRNNVPGQPMTRPGHHRRGRISRVASSCSRATVATMTPSAAGTPEVPNESATRPRRLSSPSKELSPAAPSSSRSACC